MGVFLQKSIILLLRVFLAKFGAFLCILEGVGWLIWWLIFGWLSYDWWPTVGLSMANESPTPKIWHLEKIASMPLISFIIPPGGGCA